MQKRTRWALGGGLAALFALIAFGTAARSTFVLPDPIEPTQPRVVDRVRELFPQTVGWFRIVGGARFEPGQGGRLVPILSTLTHPRVRWQDGAGHAVVSQFAPRFGTATRIGSTEHRSIWLDLLPQGGRDVEAQIQDGLVVYPDAYPSTDVLFKSTPTHVDEYLLLRDERAPAQWRYHVRLGPGLARIRQAGNQIEAVDAREIPWLRATMPRAVDREGRKADGTIRIDGDRVEVALDLSGLSYPILVDPDWRSTGDMAYGRFYHRTDVLDDGRVIATGGCSASICSMDLTLPACRAVVPAIEALDLESRTFARVADSPTPRFFHATQRLPNGSILIAGGCTSPSCSSTSFDVEVFEPSTNTLRAAAGLDEAGGGQSAALLPDGRVLLAGGCTTLGCTARAFAYDPGADVWTELAPMRTPRGRAESITLPGGRVLITGGCSNITCSGVHATAELFDPASGEWLAVSDMLSARGGHWIASLNDGRAIVGGGCSAQDCASVLSSTEIFEPSSLTFTVGPQMLRPRVGAIALALPNASVLVNQGCASRDSCDLTNEVLEPETGLFAAVEPAVTVRAFHQTVLHPDGVVLANGGCQPSTCSWWNETWDVADLVPPDGGIAWPDSGPAADGGPRDAGVDAPTDGGSGVSGGGCGCRLAGSRPSTLAWAPLLLLLFLRRRR